MRFGDTYYIYATTDGFAGWGSSKFTVVVLHGPGPLDRPRHHPRPRAGHQLGGHQRLGADRDREEREVLLLLLARSRTSASRSSDSPLGPFTDPLGKPLVEQGRLRQRPADRPGGLHRRRRPVLPVLGQRHRLRGPAQRRHDLVRRRQASDDHRAHRLPRGPVPAQAPGHLLPGWSIDDTGSENYRVGYAHRRPARPGRSPSKGEILDEGPALGILGTGHHSIIQVPGTDDWYIAYHRFAIPGGDGTHRETTIDRLYFADDGTIKKVVPTLTGVDPLRYRGGSPGCGSPTRAPTAGTAPTRRLTLAHGELIRLVEYQVDGGGWFPYREPVALPAGRHTVEYRAQGVNLFWSEPWSTSVQVDRVAPTAEATLTGRALVVTGWTPTPGSPGSSTGSTVGSGPPGPVRCRSTTGRTGSATARSTWPATSARWPSCGSPRSGSRHPDAPPDRSTVGRRVRAAVPPDAPGHRRPRPRPRGGVASRTSRRRPPGCCRGSRSPRAGARCDSDISHAGSPGGRVPRRRPVG